MQTAAQEPSRINLSKILSLPNREVEKVKNVKIDKKYLESLVKTYDR